MAGFCWIYHHVIDPLLYRSREEIALMIPPGTSLIELGSGTGAQAAAAASRTVRYLGVELNPSFTACADRYFKAPQYKDLNFITADGRDLSFIGENEFDMALISLALHEMAHPMRLQVLEEMKRLATSLIIADYSSPLPASFAGWMAHGIERLAGGAHYAGYLDYQQRGGLPDLLRQAGLLEIRSSHLLSDVLHVVLAS